MSRTQRGIALTAGPSLLLIALAFGLGGTGSIELPADWADDRMRLAAGCAAAIGFTLIWAILDVSIGRFFSPADIAGAAFTEPTEAIKIRRAILANTHEQVVAAAIAYFAYAALAPAPRLALLPMLAALFVVGRIAFRIGYPRGAIWRSPGFVLTFLPTILVYLLILQLWISPAS